MRKKMYSYVLRFNDYYSAVLAMRKLHKKRGVFIRGVIVIVETDHHNKVKPYLSRQDKNIVILLF